MSEKKFKKKSTTSVRAVIANARSSWIPVNNPKSDIKGFTKVLVDLQIYYKWSLTGKVHVHECTMHRHKNEFRFATEVFGRHNPNKSFTEKEMEEEMVRLFKPYGWKIVRQRIEELKVKYFTRKNANGTATVEKAKQPARDERPEQNARPKKGSRPNGKAKAVPSDKDRDGHKGEHKRKKRKGRKVPTQGGTAKHPASKTVQGRVGRTRKRR